MSIFDHLSDLFYRLFPPKRPLPNNNFKSEETPNLFTKPRRKIKKVFVHCSASDAPAHDNVATLRQWHVVENGWKDIGYHYFITKDGMIHECRSLEMTPSAQQGYNTGSIAICLSGLMEFTEAQYDSLRLLCREMQSEIEGVTFHGHCEVNKYKKCPVFNYKDVLSLNENGVMIYKP